MAAPIVDFTPLLKLVIPFMIIAAVAGFLVNAISPARRRRRRRRPPSDPPLIDIIADSIARWLRGGRFDPNAPTPRGFTPSFRPSPPPKAERSCLTRIVVRTPQEWTLANLQKLEWKRFEMLTTQFLEALGFNARMTRVGADGGVDVELRRSGSDALVGVAQCKAWHTYKVGVKPIRELFGVMAAAQVQHGVFVTTSVFTEEALEFAHGKSLELIDGNALISFIRQLPQDRQDALLDSAFSGDYATPTCPNCDVKMVSRTAHKGNTPGSTFWGCPRYPRCKQTFKIRQEQ